ncbi:MAG: hypothetical protein H6862_00430 [Rhodospirillales bacterium]|nr:hypothetical protein [Rhodospirillales bacterium]
MYKTKPAILILCICLIPALWACSGTLPTQQKPDLTLAGLPPMAVNVGLIEVINRYDPSADPQDVSSSFPTPPDIALRRYGEARLKAAGVSGRLQFIIENARVHQLVKDPDSKIQRWMQVNRREQYDILATVRLILLDEAGTERQGTVLTARRTLELPASLSVASREEKQVESLEALIKDMDVALVNGVYNTLGLSAGVPVAPLGEIGPSFSDPKRDGSGATQRWR